MGLEDLLLIGVAATVRATKRGMDTLRSGEIKQISSALDTLEKRYAQGEIDSDEFHERRAIFER